jgi:hypothetical protein
MVAPILPNQPVEEGKTRPEWSETYTFDPEKFLWQTLKMQSGSVITYSTPVCLGQSRVTSVSQEFCLTEEGKHPTTTSE